MLFTVTSLIVSSLLNKPTFNILKSSISQYCSTFLNQMLTHMFYYNYGDFVVFLIVHFEIITFEVANDLYPLIDKMTIFTL
jgi:hypothetical protein